MATNAEAMANEDFYGVTVCHLCSKPFTDSRMLPCVHTFCLSCLEEWMNSEENPEEKSNCPICHQAFEIPEGGCCNLKENNFVNRLLKTKKLSSLSESQCDVCVEESGSSAVDETIKPAKFYCIECQQRLCEACSNDHRRQKLLKSHNLMTFGNIGSRKQLVTENALPSPCAVHGHEIVKMYCASCEQVICMMCFAENHQSHSCVYIAKAVDEFRRSLVEVEISAKSVKEKGKQLKERLEAEKKNLTDGIEASKTAVLKRTEELEELIVKHKKLLLDSLNLKESKYKQKIETMEVEFNEAIKVMDTFLSYSTALKESGSPADICQSVNGLKSATAFYLKQNEKIIEPNPPSFTDAFVATNLNLFETNASNIVGKMIPATKGFQFPLPSEATTRAASDQVSATNTCAFGGVFAFSDGGNTSREARFHSEAFNFNFGGTTASTAGTSVQSATVRFGAEVGTAQTQKKLDNKEVIVVKEDIKEQGEIPRKRSVIRLTSLYLEKCFAPTVSPCGVAHLKGFIYILTLKCILTYKRQPNFDLVKTIMLPPEIDITDTSTGDLAESEGKDCLYLRCGNMVWKLTADGDRAELWLSCDSQVTSMSASFDGTVLLGTFENQNAETSSSVAVKKSIKLNWHVVAVRATLNVYTSDGKLCQKFLMPDNNKRLHLAIFASNGNIILSFDDKTELLEMNLQGVIFRSYRHYLKSRTYQVQCVAVKGNGLLIGYTTPNGHGMLIAVDSDFQLEQVILPSTNYTIANFGYIFYSNKHSQLLTVPSSAECHSLNPLNINLFCIKNV